MPTHNVSIAFNSVGPVSSGMTPAAYQRVHLTTRWNMVYLCTNSKSHSTCLLKSSGTEILHEFAGPGFAHSLHTRQVWTTSGMMSMTWSGTPTLPRNSFICCSVACHQRVCNLLNVRRIAPSRPVLNSLVTFPISKFDQSAGLCGLSPASLQVWRSRC